MTALAPVVPRLIKLLPLLGSDKDGEVVATARAICRTLASAGADWHDLAGALDKPPETKTVVLYRDRPSPEPTTWAEVARWCRENERGRLAAHERKFVSEIAARLVCGGEPTERQGAWLRALYARLRTST